MAQAKYSAINGLRAIGALSIVSVHVLKFLYKPPYEGVFSFLSIGEWAVEMFFIVSAFGMCCGYYNRIKNSNISVNDFYTKRYKRTLPFWIFMLTVGVLSAPSLDNIIQFFLEAPLTFNLCFYPSLSLLQVGWFLGMIFTFYIIFPFFVFMLWTKRRAWFVLMITIFLSLLSTYYYEHTEGWSTFKTVGVSIIVFSPRFVVGGLIFLYKDQIANTFKSISRKMSSIIRGIMIVLIAISFYAMTYESFVLNAFNILFVLYAISFSKYPLLDNKVTNVLSDLSFEIYLSHMLIFRVLERSCLTHLFENYTLNYICVLTIVFVGAFLFSYVIKYYVLPTLMKVPTLIIKMNK